MNTRALGALRAKLSADRPVYGLWITMESPAVSEIATALAIDFIVIDGEHGALDWKDVANHLRSAARGDTVALVRLPVSEEGSIKRALDLGADGVVLPRIESAKMLDQAFRYSLYPPEGMRGMGAERATAWGKALREHSAEANENVFVVPIIETVEGARNIEAICQDPRLSLLQIGPADFSASAGHRGHWEGPGVAKEILRVLSVARQAGKHCGIMATSDEDLSHRVSQGFQFVGLGMDAGLLIKSLTGMLEKLGRPTHIRADLRPATL